MQGKKLADGDMYIITIIDLEPAGVLVKAYNQNSGTTFTLSPTENMLASAKLTRTEADMTTLADSIDVSTNDNGTKISSSLQAIKDTKVIPQGPAVTAFVQNTQCGDQSLPDILTTALSELCKAKPAGLNAVRWLGEWLLANNPSQPHVDVPEEEDN